VRGTDWIRSGWGPTPVPYEMPPPPHRDRRIQQCLPIESLKPRQALDSTQSRLPVASPGWEVIRRKHLASHEQARLAESPLAENLVDALLAFLDLAHRESVPCRGR